MNTSTNSVQKTKLRQFSIALLTMIAVFGVASSYYFYAKYNSLKSNPNLEVQKETEKVVSTLGKLMELPKDEVPTIATISDKEKLKDQAFFSTAENGDVLFAYTTAMKAILYRPSTNKIINVAPININQAQDLSQGTKQGTTTTPASLKVAYYNGTQTVGLSTIKEKTVKERYPSWQTTALTNAARRDYRETVVVDISKKHPQEAADLATLLGGRVESLPEGEVAPNADFLIISGK